MMPGPDEVHVWYAHVSALDKAPRRYLSREELTKASSYRFAEDSMRYVAAHELLRGVLSGYMDRKPDDVTLEYGKSGKPYLSSPGMRFSLSRSGDIVAAAVSSSADVGLDVEKLIPGFEYVDVVNAYYSPREAAYIDAVFRPERPAVFFRLWTRKEAVLKATGEGIAGLSPSLDVLEKDYVCRHGVRWRLYDITIVPEYAASLAVGGSPRQVKVLKYHFS